MLVAVADVRWAQLSRGTAVGVSMWASAASKSWRAHHLEVGGGSTWGRTLVEASYSKERISVEVNDLPRELGE